MRDQDEHLKGAAEAGTEMAASSTATLVTSSEHGANPAAQVRSLAAEIRVLLFDQDTIDQDNDMEDELQPDQFAPGMGSSSRSDGKYEGFGTAPQKGEGCFINEFRATLKIEPQSGVQKGMIYGNKSDTGILFF